MRHFRRHANALAQRGVWVNRFTDVHRVSAHLDGQCNLADHVTRVGADHAAAENLAVAVRLPCIRPSVIYAVDELRGIGHVAPPVSQTDLWQRTQAQFLQKVVVLVLCRRNGLLNLDQLAMRLFQVNLGLTHRRADVA